MEEIVGGLRHTDKTRLRWCLKPSETNYKQFVEGKHLVNHLANSALLTNKLKFFDTIKKLGLAMKVGAI